MKICTFTSMHQLRVIVFVFGLSFLCCDHENSSNRIQSLARYEQKAASIVDPQKALKSAYEELAVLKLNQPSVTAIHYDTCLTDDLQKHLTKNQTFKVNVLDLKYIDQFIEGTTIDDEESNWRFLHSNNFNFLVPLTELPKTTNEKTAKALAHWLNIKDIRYTVILYEQNKILPRVNFENYVLGGYFQGHGILYDLKEYKAICYFPFRVNNLSNTIEDYTKEGMDIYDAMMNELKNEMKLKIQFELARKLNIEEALIEPGF